MDNPFFEITLSEVTLRGHHGVLPQETVVGNDFRFDITLRIPPTPGMAADALEGTISYADIFDLLKEENRHPSKLLEHLALRIAEALKTRWPQITQGCVAITKLHPPITGFSGSARVALSF